ncbi:hypothetical protein A0H81_01209 [Grifola frondosa]|uniref:Protein transport protein Sec61 subunit gamma n=1 Tax=Grifola frondosa TaxID=5627 RepID=A0A1C7MRG7_GRIFR|nr:hypothetical protein A0H81_01209 [Grifola frondosa]
MKDEGGQQIVCFQWMLSSRTFKRTFTFKPQLPCSTLPTAPWDCSSLQLAAVVYLWRKVDAGIYFAERWRSRDLITRRPSFDSAAVCTSPPLTLIIKNTPSLHPPRCLKSLGNFWTFPNSLYEMATSSLHAVQSLRRKVANARTVLTTAADVCAEFAQICKAVAVGFAVMGFIGYFVKLIHIPINNILVGGA